MYKSIGHFYAQTFSELSQGPLSLKCYSRALILVLRKKNTYDIDNMKNINILLLFNTRMKHTSASITFLKNRYCCNITPNYL